MTKIASLTHRNIYVQTFMLFTQLAGATIKYMDTRFYREFQLSFIKYSVLRALARNGGTLKHTQLAIFTNTKKHNITTLVDRMKKDQLVTTEWSETDRRVNNVIITNKGRKLYRQANQTARKMVEQLMHSMKESDVQEAARLLNIVKENMESN
jgi:DNA-binding MarR family transcriptional regulator